MALGQNCSSPAEERGWTWRSHRGLAVSSHAASADACPIWAGPTRGSRDTRKTDPCPRSGLFRESHEETKEGKGSRQQRQEAQWWPGWDQGGPEGLPRRRC